MAATPNNGEALTAPRGVGQPRSQADTHPLTNARLVPSRRDHRVRRAQARPLPAWTFGFWPLPGSTLAIG